MPFSHTYQEARNRFIETAKAKNLTLGSLLNPERGPNKEPLYTDVAWYGSSQAHNLIIINSATHGVEGFCGSGCQLFTLEKDLKQVIPSDTALLFIHALNPYGFAWLRRANENNVDLNRNFVNHQQSYPDNLLYDKIHDFLDLNWLDGQISEQVNKLWQEYQQTYGLEALQSAICQGQYSHSDGVMYGGNEETWSNKILHQILAEYGRQAEKVVFIDLHSGLGPYGHGEIIYEQKDAGYNRVQQWFGSVTLPGNDIVEGAPVARITGLVIGAVEKNLTSAQVTAFFLEFGTYTFDHMFQALCAEQWHFNNRLPLTKATHLKTNFKDALYPNKDDWKKMVLDRYNDILIQTLRGIRISHT